MRTLTIEYPESLLATLNLSAEAFEQEAKTALAVKFRKAPYCIIQVEMLYNTFLMKTSKLFEKKFSILKEISDAMIITENITALALAIRRGKLNYKEACALKSHLLKIPDLLEKTLEKDDAIKELARTLIYAKGFLYLGRGINYPIALEGALKLKEISYIHAEGYPAGEMKHGPIALIEEGLPVVVLAPRDDLFEKIFSNIEEVKARGGRVIAVTDNPESLANKVNDLIEVPTTHHTLFPFVNVIPLQLLSYHIAVLRGCDVDQPRNLAKSVTVE